MKESKCPVPKEQQPTNEFLELSKTHKYKLSKEPEKQTKKNPPTPFTTSGLQQAANNNMHISPKNIFNAQILFETVVIFSIEHFILV